MSFSEIDYSAGEPAPIDLLEQLFDANGWASERVGDEEIITTVKGGWCTYQLRALWRGTAKAYKALDGLRLQAVEEELKLMFESGELSPDSQNRCKQLMDTRASLKAVFAQRQRGSA